jgi:hypothetical protein
MTDPLSTFTDDEITAMHARAAAAFYDTLHVYATLAPSASTASPRRRWSRPTATSANSPTRCRCAA